MTPTNAITDVDGVLVGHHQRIGDGWATGTTVVLLPPGSTGAVDGRGGAPGTRETDLLAPENMVQQVDAVCLSGGSAYGLAAADGVMSWLSERSRGFRVGAAEYEVVPIVPAAGTGAKVGSLKGGVGTASAVVDGFTVGALAAVNAAGEAVDPSSGRPWAADHEVSGEFGVAWPDRPGVLPAAGRDDLNTTIGVVAVDADLSKAECRRLAVAAQDGLARAVRPAHSMFDGDTVFAVATRARPLAPADSPFGPMARAAALDRLCAATAEVFARAVVHGVLSATPLAGLPAYRDIWPADAR
jgi:L-aminopeptidase/D-esterase-like protein